MHTHSCLICNSLSSNLTIPNKYTNFACLLELGIVTDDGSPSRVTQAHSTILYTQIFRFSQRQSISKSDKRTQSKSLFKTRHFQFCSASFRFVCLQKSKNLCALRSHLIILHLYFRRIPFYHFTMLQHGRKILLVFKTDVDYFVTLLAARVFTASIDAHFHLMYISHLTKQKNSAEKRKKRKPLYRRRFI